MTATGDTWPTKIFASRPTLSVSRPAVKPLLGDARPAGHRLCHRESRDRLLLLILLSFFFSAGSQRFSHCFLWIPCPVSKLFTSIVYIPYLSLCWLFDLCLFVCLFVRLYIYASSVPYTSSSPSSPSSSPYRSRQHLCCCLPIPHPLCTRSTGNEDTLHSTATMSSSAVSHIWDVQYDTTTIITLVTGSCLVLIMCFGLAYLYSGLARRKSALHMIFSVFFVLLISIFQWYFWGYSLAFSTTASNKFIGNLHNFGYQNLNLQMVVDETHHPLGIPEMAFANFQGMFASITACIYIGALCERGRILPFIPFTFCWLTVVYCPVTCWIWNSSGWAYKWGVLDYAGGGPVEILSGFSGFVISYFLGPRKEHLMINFRPHNVSMVTIGTMLLWFGWLGFNGLTCVTPSLKSVYAIMNSNLCAAFGGFTWVLLDFYRTNHWSTVGLCSGIISGLVAATPTSGVIPLWASVILGILSGCVCNFATVFKVWFQVDDALDVLAEHGIAGVLGLFFNSIFAADYVIGYDGYTEHPGGWINHNWKQMYKQIAYIGAVVGYCCVVTALLCFVLDKIPYCKLRADEEAEEAGMDEDQIGEFAYDYVEVRRNFFDVNGFEGVPDSSNPGTRPVSNASDQEKQTDSVV